MEKLKDILLLKHKPFRFLNIWLNDEIMASYKSCTECFNATSWELMCCSAKIFDLDDEDLDIFIDVDDFKKNFIFK